MECVASDSEYRPSIIEVIERLTKIQKDCFDTQEAAVAAEVQEGIMKRHLSTTSVSYSTSHLECANRKKMSCVASV